MKCPNCAANVKHGARYCSYCGTAMPKEQAPPSSTEEVFARIKRSDAYRERNDPERLASLPQYGMLRVLGPALFGLFFAGFAVFFIVMAFGAGVGQEGVFALPFLIVPGIFIVVGLGLFFGAVAKGKRIASAPVASQPAIVTGKRTRVSGGGRNSQPRTQYHATFEFEDGRREEFAVEQDLYAELSDDDAGVLFTRADWVAAFDRVRQ